MTTRPFASAQRRAQLAALRATGLSQASIAARLGVSQAAVSYRLAEPPPPATRQCAVCPVVFEVDQRERRKRRFCSAACKQRDYRWRITA